ncbi:hypothetical protein [Mucilaginibacter sp.]|uniref:hypothetical protein n=1 Tax=Mucilaginibacter sp. TaxID=1882438 RepID=UPI0025E87161|nr:hypothetical protein [Mucilaginibacter sp.]
MTLDKNQSTSTAPSTKSKSRKYRTLMILGVCLALVIGLLFYNKTYLTLSYINIRYNKFRVNDKLYAKNWLINEKSEYGSYNLHLYRKIRPLNNVNSSNKPAIIECPFSISSDSLCKYKTACIGNYAGSEILDVKLSHGYHPMICFSIITNRKALIKEEESSLTQLPSGYVYDEGPFYVLMLDVTPHELVQFRKLSK